MKILVTKKLLQEKCEENLHTCFFIKTFAQDWCLNDDLWCTQTRGKFWVQYKPGTWDFIISKSQQATLRDRKTFKLRDLTLNSRLSQFCQLH